MRPTANEYGRDKIRDAWPPITNGVKVTIMLEELLARGIKEAEYDAYLIDINEGEQFGSDFVKLNPNSNSLRYYFTNLSHL